MLTSRFSRAFSAPLMGMRLSSPVLETVCVLPAATKKLQQLLTCFLNHRNNFIDELHKSSMFFPSQIYKIDMYLGLLLICQFNSMSSVCLPGHIGIKQMQSSVILL